MEVLKAIRCSGESHWAYRIYAIICPNDNKNHSSGKAYSSFLHTRMVQQRHVWEFEINGAYRNSVNSSRSLSESSKNKETTSKTNSGLLSSCNCCNCVNCWSNTSCHHPNPVRSSGLSLQLHMIEFSTLSTTSNHSNTTHARTHSAQTHPIPVQHTRSSSAAAKSLSTKKLNYTLCTTKTQKLNDNKQ